MAGHGTAWHSMAQHGTAALADHSNTPHLAASPKYFFACSSALKLKEHSCSKWNRNVILEAVKKWKAIKPKCVLSEAHLFLVVHSASPINIFSFISIACSIVFQDLAPKADTPWLTDAHGKESKPKDCRPRLSFRLLIMALGSLHQMLRMSRHCQAHTD